MFLPAQIKPGAVCISTYFFKVFLTSETGCKIWAFMAAKLQWSSSCLTPWESGPSPGTKHPKSGRIVLCGHYISGWAIPWWGTLLWGRGTSGLLELFPMGSISLLALRVPLMEPNLQKVWALRAADTSQEPGACYGNRFRIMPASQASPCDIKNTS